MTLHAITVAGIDVGGERKGFHAVALRDGVFETTASTNAGEIVDWCRARGATIVAVDAPCAWSQSSMSRQAERDLRLGGRKIHCFATPTRARADGKRFYGWVFNGEKLYQRLTDHFRLFDGDRRDGSICFETFPHAVICALAGSVVATTPKVSTRRAALRDLGYDDRVLANIDFVDAGLCAVAADKFGQGCTRLFGERADGFIVVPELEISGARNGLPART